MSVVSRWIDLPRTMLEEPSEPYLVTEALLPELRTFVTDADAAWAEVDVAGVEGTGAMIDALKSVLPFPEWCASSWDSVDDAFEEIRQGWSFPLVIAVRGLRSSLETRPHLGLEAVVRLSALGHAFSVAGDQLTVVYVADRWAWVT